MYRIMKSTNNGMDELELDSLEKGCWIDIVSPSPEELHEVADATGIQMDFLSAALDDEEKSRIETDRHPCPAQQQRLRHAAARHYRIGRLHRYRLPGTQRRYRRFFFLQL